MAKKKPKPAGPPRKMLEFTGTLFEYAFEYTKWHTDLKKAMIREQRFAAKAWLRAVYPRVVVWTGQSRASLLPLAEFLKMFREVDVSIDPKVHRAARGIGQGEKIGEGSYDFKTVENQTFIFRFDIRELAWRVNEFYNANLLSPEAAAEAGSTGTGFHLTHPGPYLALRHGQVAWERHVEKSVPAAFPDLSKYIQTLPIVIRGKFRPGRLPKPDFQLLAYGDLESEYGG